MEFDVVEVLKGKKEFQAGKTYRCLYGNGWRKHGIEEFAEGGTYLLPLDPMRKPETKKWNNALIVYLDDNCGLYKIENATLLDKYNFFSLGNALPWTEFVPGYNKRIEAVKKGEF